MTFQNYKGLNSTFNTEEVEAPEINENLCFNSELIKQIREKSPSIVDQLEDNGTVYAELVHEEPQLIWTEQIHGLEEITDKNGNVRPRGFQTRNDEDVNHDVVDDLADDMQKKRWDPTERTGVVFVLEGTDYEGCSYSTRGVERLYGIANLTHRLEAAKQAGEDYIAAWVVRIDMMKFRKWANAVLNNKTKSDNPITEKDIAATIQADIETEGHELAALLNRATNDTEKRDALTKEVESYNVKARTVDVIVRLLEQMDVLQMERKRHDAQTIPVFFSTYLNDWQPSKDKNLDYETDKGCIVTVIAQGNNHLSVVNKIAEHKNSGSEKVLRIAVANNNNKDYNVTEENRDILRLQFPKKVREHMKKISDAYIAIYQKGSHPAPEFVFIPEFADEYSKIDPEDEGTVFIRL